MSQDWSLDPDAINSTIGLFNPPGHFGKLTLHFAKTRSERRRKLTSCTRRDVMLTSSGHAPEMIKKNAWRRRPGQAAEWG
jgi:hypothetical protein